MKNVLVITLIALILLSCQSKLKEQEQIFLAKRDFIVQDAQLKEKPLFVPLPAGSVSPEGWIRDGAGLAAQGITGHLDEWTTTHQMAWKGVGFEARGADPKTGMGWPLEQASYWLDGAVRLAYILKDTALIHKISDRLNMVVDGVLAGGKSFVYWQDVDYSKTNTNSPYRTVYYGPLLFTLPLKDIDSNTQAPDQKWSYAMISDAPASIEIIRSEMPAHWTWQIEEAPVKLIAKATEFEWKPNPAVPMPPTEVSGNKDVDITLVPYGCTKFRITMFPVAKSKKYQYK